MLKEKCTNPIGGNLQFLVTFLLARQYCITASLFNQKIELYNSVKINRIRQIFLEPLHAKVGLPFFYTHCTHV